MRKLLFFGTICLLAKSVLGAGSANNLTVSSGTFQAVSMYSNDDGGSRQAVIIGNRTSSDTLRVDLITGIPVSLSTSALTTANGVKIEAGLTGIPIVSTNTLNTLAAQSGAWTITNSTVGANIIGTVPISGTVGATQSGTWTVQPGNTANTTAWKVDGSAVTQPVSGTVAATQSGAWSVTNSTVGVNVIGTVPVSGTLTVNPGSIAFPIVSTNTLNVNPYSTTTIGDGVTPVNVAGTRVALASSTPCKVATVCSDPTNTGVLAVGGTTVVAAAATRRGVPLGPGDCYTVKIDNLIDINVDSTVSGSSATYSYQN